MVYTNLIKFLAILHPAKDKNRLNSSLSRNNTRDAYTTR